jgi:hypothetical protein
MSTVHWPKKRFWAIFLGFEGAGRGFIPNLDSLKKPLMDKYNELLEMVTSMEKDFQKFYDGDNKAAGTRIRKGLQDLKAHCQTLRLEVQEMKNNG